MFDNSIPVPDDQVYRQLIAKVIQSDAQFDDITVKDLLWLLDKLSVDNSDLAPHALIAEWLKYAL